MDVKDWQTRVYIIQSLKSSLESGGTIERRGFDHVDWHPQRVKKRHRFVRAVVVKRCRISFSGRQLLVQLKSNEVSLQSLLVGGDLLVNAPLIFLSKFPFQASTFPILSPHFLGKISTSALFQPCTEYRAQPASPMSFSTQQLHHQQPQMQTSYPLTILSHMWPRKREPVLDLPKTPSTQYPLCSFSASWLSGSSLIQVNILNHPCV